MILENQLDDLGETAETQEDTQVSGNLLDNSTNPDGPADASIVSYDWGINIGVPAGVAATITGVGTLIINPDGAIPLLRLLTMMAQFPGELSGN